MDESKKISVGVLGLGFVGFVMSLVLANSRKKYNVIGFDIDPQLVKKINSGILPIKSSDKNVNIFFKNSIKNKNFQATLDQSKISLCDVIIIDINLDVIKENNLDNLEYDVDLNPFKKAIKTVGENCKEDVLVIVETTVPPGTCEMVIKPIMKKCYKQRGIDFNKLKIGHSYERVMPGPDYINSIINFPRVYSGINKISESQTKEFLETFINTDLFPLQKLHSTTASETAKVLENSYRAMNIAFIDEWTKFAETAGINLHEIISVIKVRPTHNNMMLPGFGVGGYCLTKDPLLASWASQNLFKSIALSQSEKSVLINDNMPFHTLDKIIEINKTNKIKNILVLGISYLKNIGDLRYSPFLKISDSLKKLCDNLLIFDPLIDKNKYTTNSFSEIKNKRFDVILIGCPHDIFITESFLFKILKNNKDSIIIDPFNFIQNSEEIKNKIILIGNGK